MLEDLPTDDDVEAAVAAVRRWIAPSPMCVWFDGGWLKDERALPTRSFKLRGALAALTALQARGATAVVAASAGNHGQGVGWAAQRLGIEARIVVPRDCPALKLSKMRALAAVIVCEEPGYDAAEAWARTLADRDGVPFVSPFADRDVMAGNGGTLAREVLASCPEVATLVVPVGGGGLFAGLVSTVRRARPQVRVVAVQAAASPALALSLEHDRWHATLPAAETLAEGLEGGVGRVAWELARQIDGLQVELVSEREIGEAMGAMRSAWGNVEGSAAVVEAVRARGALYPLPRPIVGILTGGNVSDDVLAALAPPRTPEPVDAP